MNPCQHGAQGDGRRAHEDSRQVRDGPQRKGARTAVAEDPPRGKISDSAADREPADNVQHHCPTARAASRRGNRHARKQDHDGNADCEGQKTGATGRHCRIMASRSLRIASRTGMAHRGGRLILDVGCHGVGIGQPEDPLSWTLAWTATPSRYAVTSISSIGRASAACPYMML